MDIFRFTSSAILSGKKPLMSSLSTQDMYILRIMSPLLYKGYKFNQKNVLHNPFKSDVFSFGLCGLFAASLCCRSL